MFWLDGGDPLPRDPCPEIEPIPNTDCNHWYMKCEYGNDPRPECRKRFDCLAAGPDPTMWVDFSPKTPCAPLDTTNCPVAPPGSTLCVPNESLCVYPDGSQCACFGTWKCSLPPNPQCPAIAPNLGTSCAMEGLLCSYGDCAFGTAIGRICSGGVWHNQPQGCNG